MFKHEKMLFHPVEIERPNPQYAALLQEQLGGGNGELKAAMQYMSQSFRIKDPEIKDLFLDIAAEEGLDYHFATISIPGAHPNTARITLTGEHGAHAELCGASIGGGNILVTEINGLEVSVTGQHNTLVVLHHDKPGTIAAVTNFMAYSGLNIGNFRLARPRKGGEAVMTIEVDGEIPGVLLESLKILPNIINVILIRAI